MSWLRRFLNPPPTGNPWEIFLELLGEWKLLRRGVAIGLLILFWGNWPMMDVVLVSWATYEGVDYGTDHIKDWWRSGKS
jgi:hypothetical protein